MRKRYWIVDITCSERVQKKLSQRGISLGEIYQAVAYYRYEEATWREDADRGRRLFVTGRTDGGKPLLVILGETDPTEGVWHLRSAWRND